jgi:ApbE family
MAVRALQAAGMTQGLVNAGGDMRAFGAGSHAVHLRFESGLRHVADFHHSALATSCNASQASIHVDPRTGQHTSVRHSVVAHAPTAMLANAFTKIALLCPGTANRLCQSPTHGPQTQWRAFDIQGRPNDATHSFADGTVAAVAVNHHGRFVVVWSVMDAAATRRRRRAQRRCWRSAPPRASRLDAPARRGRLLGLFVCGVLATGHVPIGWRLTARQHAPGQRRTGVLLCALAGVLVPTVYLLHYFAPESLRPSLGWLHTAVGVVMACVGG